MIVGGCDAIVFSWIPRAAGASCPRRPQAPERMALSLPRLFDFLMSLSRATFWTKRTMPHIWSSFVRSWRMKPYLIIVDRSKIRHPLRTAACYCMLRTVIYKKNFHPPATHCEIVRCKGWKNTFLYAVPLRTADFVNYCPSMMLTSEVTSETLISPSPFTSPACIILKVISAGSESS